MNKITKNYRLTSDLSLPCETISFADLPLPCETISFE
jgi:hypothetical protein